MTWPAWARTIRQHLFMILSVECGFEVFVLSNSTFRDIVKDGLFHIRCLFWAISATMYFYGMMAFTTSKRENKVDSEILTKIERNTTLQYNELKKLNELNERLNSTNEDSESSSDSEDDSDFEGSEEEGEISGEELSDLHKHTDFDLPGFRKRPDHYNENLNESPSEFRRRVEYMEKLSTDRSRELRFGNGEL